MALQHICIGVLMAANSMTHRAKSLPAWKLPQARLCMGKLLVWIWNGGSKRTRIFLYPQVPESPGRSAGKEHLRMAGSKTAIKSSPCASPWSEGFMRRASGNIATLCLCMCLYPCKAIVYVSIGLTVCLAKTESEVISISALTHL